MKISTLLLALGLFSGTAATAQGTLSNGLLAYYPFTGNTQDVSGNNRHLTNSGATLAAGASGTPNSAYYFNGTNSFMQLGTSAGINFIGDFTICMKVKPLGYFSGPCHGNALFHKAGPSGNDPYGVAMLFDDNYYTGGRNCSNPTPDTLHQNFYIVKVNSGAVATTYNINKPPFADYNVWRSLVMIQKGDSLYQFIDSVLINQVYAPSYSNGNNFDIFLGKNNNVSNTFYFKGVMDELRFYNRALTSTEVISYSNYNPPALAVSHAGTVTSVILAPNPANDLLKLTNSSSQPVSFRVLNIQGSEVTSGTAKPGENEVMVSQLPKGLYLLQLRQGEIVETRRFLKN